MLDYKALCRKYFPHLEIVRDFTDSKHRISPEQRELMSQKEIMEIEQQAQLEFSEEREKHGFSYGGSDIPIIIGKGFIPASQLAEQKRNPDVKGKVSATTQAMFDTGHRAEDSIRETFERVTGYRTIPWPIMMRNPKYPHFLMNIDGLFFKDGAICHYEGKWSQNFQIINNHWKKARDLRKDGIEPGPSVSPEKYLYQVWGYQAGLDVDLSVICGGWGYADNEIGYIYIPRLPKDKEKELMDACEHFIKLVESGLPVSDYGFKNKSKLHDFYKKLHAQLPDSGKPVVFPPSEMESAKRFIELQDQIKELEHSVEDQVSEFKEQLMEQCNLAALKEERDNIQVFFEGKMGGDSVGTINDGESVATIHWDVAKKPRRTFDKALCEEKYPEVFKEVYTGTPTKSLRIEIEDPEEGGEE